MSAIIVNGATPFGSMSNAGIADLISAIEDIHRVNLAAAAAQSGVPEPVGAALETGSNFGVMPDAAEPGKQGTAYSYALDVLDQALQAFLAANQAQITALDNGGKLNVTELKSWMKENATLVYFLIAQAVAIASAGLAFTAYMVRLETRVTTLEVRGSPHLGVIDNRLTVLESQTRDNKEGLDRVVTIMTRELHISPQKDK